MNIELILLLIIALETLLTLAFIYRCKRLSNLVTYYENAIDTMQLTGRSVPKKNRTMWD